VPPAAPALRAQTLVAGDFSGGFQRAVTGLTPGRTRATCDWTNGVRTLNGGGDDGTTMSWDVRFGSTVEQGTPMPTVMPTIAPTITQASQYAQADYKPWVQTTLALAVSTRLEALFFFSKIPTQGFPQSSVLALANVQIVDVTPAPEPATLAPWP